AQHLKQYGWGYVVVVFLWSFDTPPGSTWGNPYQSRLKDGSYIPWLSMDEWGRLLPHFNKFPSSIGGKGFKPLGDYVHSLGLHFGIHVMRGIPRQAVWAKSPVKGAPGITANMIADTSSTCGWMNHMYGLDMSKPGAQEYLNSLLDLYASWGVDFIKVDDLSRPYHKAEVEGYKKAIEHCGRPVLFSLSPGATPVAEAAHVATYGNMWRMADDFWDNWKEILQMMDFAAQWEGKGGPGHWPDADMLQIGKLSKRGPVGPERFSRFTDDELQTHMTFWCIYRSPLIMGGNLPENRAIETRLLTNDEVLAVNQQGENPKLVLKTDSVRIWKSEVAGTKDIYVALFNTGNHAGPVKVSFAQLGLKGKVTVRDLWEKKELGSFKKEFSATIPSHGSVLVKMAIAK
ncbi:MAG: glycoside hydrolase family 27 protein, partial [Bacteroidetes bacterium]|nr:glycoside hydrolase family 27 protein [Bacteroidota bacterium]